MPALHAVAPQQTEPPFVVTQVAVLALFIVLTVFAAKRFRSDPSHTPDVSDEISRRVILP